MSGAGPAFPDPGRHGRHISWLAAADAAGKLLSVVYFIYVTRQLGLEEHGWYGVYVALAPVFSVIATAGFYDVIARDAARDPAAAPSLMAAAMIVQLVILTLLAPLAWLGAVLAGYPPSLQGVVVMASAVAFLSGAVNVHFAVMASREGFAHISWLTVAGRFCAVAGGMGALALGLGLWGLLAAVVGAHAMQLLLAHGAARRVYGLRLPCPRMFRMRYLVRQGGGMALGRLGQAGYYGIDLPLLSALGAPAVAGYYAMGTRLFTLLSSFTDLLESVFYPVISRRVSGPASEQAFAVERFLKGMALLGFPLAVGGAVLAADLAVFLGGERYAPGAPAVAVLTGVLALTMLDRASVLYFRARALQHLPMVVYGAAFLLKLGLGAVAIPRYGMMGLLAVSAGVSIAMTCILLALAVRALPELRPRSLAAGALARPAAAAALMGLALWPLQGHAVWWTAPAGAAIYGAALIGLRAFDSFDKAILSRMIPLKQPSKSVE